MKTIDSDPAAIASKFINNTNKNIFLTGKAGTGKTTFLRHIIQQTHKKAVIVAPTGIAAINAGGVTLHSLFQLPFGTFIPQNQTNNSFHAFKVNDPSSIMRNMHMNETKRKLIRELELLIIDEVSMLRADLLDAIDMVLRYIRFKKNIPFGGVQVLFIGDLLQLPPVIKNEEWELLKSFYKSIFFFDARVLHHEKPVYIELDKIYRQADATFILLLNNLRNNKVTKEDIALLNNYYKPEFKPSATENYITLTTHNYKAINLNKVLLQELKGKSYYFEATIEDEFNEFAYPVEKNLELKIGAQIMFVKNDPTGAQRFFNGKIGIVSNISGKGIEVALENTTKPILLEKYEWKNIKYSLHKSTNEIEEIVTGTFIQYPVKLAWAITVHKSQGLTFEKAIIDIGDAFAAGQVYVALSRLKSLDGLVLSSPINYNGISQDSKVEAYSKTKSEQENLNELVEKEAALFLKNYLSHCFQFGSLINTLEEHIQSYSKNEKKSAKQKYYDWAVKLKHKLDEIKPHADTFLQQVAYIIGKKEPGYLELLDKRVNAAKEYFSPVFKNISALIFEHIEKVKPEKKIKSYLNELLELEMPFYEQLKFINKATVLSNVVVNNKEFTKEEVNKIWIDNDRIEQINKALLMPERETQEINKPAKEKRERKPRENRSSLKGEKFDTKEESFKLLKQGNTIIEIAKLRGMAISTIESHLTFYITKGHLNAEQFMSKEKIQSIIAVSKNLNTFNSGPIKQELGDDYSYGEIKFAIASYLMQ